MRGRIEEQHTIDFIFVLLLFCIFSMSALAVVYIGSHIYTNTTDTMEMNYNNNTVMEYIVEKVRQGNAYQQIEVKQLDGTCVLCIHNQINNETYTTYIYNDQNELKELYINDHDQFNKKSGTSIMEVNDVSFSIQDSLLKIDVTIHNQSQTSYISILGGTDDET